jgi:hypothetical protein
MQLVHMYSELCLYHVLSEILCYLYFDGIMKFRPFFNVDCNHLPKMKMWYKHIKKLKYKHVKFKL